MAVQRLTNRSFVQYMREFLWQPLGMTDTHGSSEIKQKQLLDRVVINQQYKRLEVPLEMSKMERATRFVEAAGGILASLPDMSRYMRHLASPKHSVYEPAPGQFRPLNALAAGVGINALFNPQLYNASVVSDLPDWEIESYGRGWMRTWYGRHLDFSHGGSLLGVRCELDIFPSQNLAVFNHMTLEQVDSAPLQVAYASVINKYIADLLLRNHSFVTEDNVCEIFNKIPADPRVHKMQRRKLTSDEVNLLTGRYANFGFGQVRVHPNETAGSLTLLYGIGKLELIPVSLTAEPEPYQFFVNLLEPQESSSPGNIIERTADSITVPYAVWANPLSFLTVRRDSVNASQLVMQSFVFEQETLLLKGLDPGSWTPPQLCPDPPKSGMKLAASLSAIVALAVAGGFSALAAI
ncbi:hypothetical protein BOX15_Mlig033915g1 [Macrostomum lignano]|uniref:Beta-lactamase-related domain-containing protein n=1 Tax=Macrostomum lignano TaxID=282301 RepID=A0A267G343_9PLAT|nr:hypothetical protein BOX15_Mlig033915g1 [Macrostomum lignano]